MFGRRTSSAQAEPEPESELKVSGKGRPTPTRAQAQAARKTRTTPPRSRKEAAARRKETMGASRAKTRMAMETGEDKYLPARDQGPVKRYIRDYIDSHRTIGQFLLPIFFVIFALVYVRASWAATLGSISWLVVLVLLVLDSLRILRGVRAGIRSRFSDEAIKGTTFYTLMRSWQMRRLRLPKPLVKPGDSI